MIAELLGFVTRQEGKKFLRLSEDVDERIVGIPGTGLGPDMSLYIHIPFCRKLCPFCCFNRYLFKEDKARQYFLDLRKELDLYISKGYMFSSFYFGGGTPTILMDELLSFIDYLNKSFEVKEISIETTPSEINLENIELLKKAGVNRLSVGVQSFDDDVLRAVGRLHSTGKEAQEKLQLVQGHFDTVNVDLIFNFPAQTIATFKRDVAIFKELCIDQATFYPLMPSPHKKDAMERKFEHVDNSQEKQYYNVILKELYNNPDYRASTAWCFSRGERMIDEYIVDYSDYIGIGSGSVSLIRGNFYVNSFSLENYHNLIEADSFPIVRCRELSEREYYRYYMLTKLFGTKLDTGQFRSSFNADINRKLLSELGFLKLFGIVEGDEIINVTPRGMYSVSVMMKEFFAALNGLREHCIKYQI